ncbi:hypothetical protein Hanom_Chr16g01464341 [Helianthus anomalus]
MFQAEKTWKPENTTYHIIMSKLNYKFCLFIFTSNFRRCHFGQKFTGSVLYLSKSCTFCPLGQTWLEISIKNVMYNAHEGKMVIFLSTLSIPHLYPSPTQVHLFNSSQHSGDF